MSAQEYEPAPPRIGNIEPITMRAEYQLPWNRQTNQTACGDTIQYQGGSKDWRVIIEGIMSKSQLDRLRQLRDQPRVEVVTEEFGRMDVAFDQLNVTRADEEDVGEINGELGPLLQFQLQTKEDSDDEEEGIEFFNENTRGTEGN
jgi:hypothetical protein